MESDNRKVLKAGLSPLGLIAFSLGTAIGWGSLVVTSSSYLAQSGVLGSVIGMLIGAAVMIVISRNYAYLMQIYPDSGGAYTYSREVFGPDYGFLTAWFLSLTYLSVLWANATSIPLFSRFFIGPVLQFGKLYTMFGYDIYVGEILITIAAILLIAVLCMKTRRASIVIMIALAAVFVFAITAVSLVTIFGHRTTWQPLYVPETRALSQVIRIAVISPWAFIGFESVSHQAAEFNFKRSRIFRLLVISVAITTALYILITLMSMTAYPERYGSWLEYIRDRGNLDGLEALPAFYAANHYMGRTGVSILMAALMSLIVTNLIGNTTAVSRLLYAMGRDNLLPSGIGRLNEKGVPQNAVMLIAVISLFIPFVGRTAIGWIVDVTTIGATLIYGLVSFSTAVKAGRRVDRIERVTGIVGVVLMIGYSLYTMIPNLISSGSIERESFLIFIVWTILGFVFFRMVLARDKERKYGKSVVVWAAMLALLLFISVVWMRQSMIAANDQMIDNVRNHYSYNQDSKRREDEEFMEAQIREVEQTDADIIMITMGLFSFAVLMMFTNHAFLNRRTRESEMIANIDPLTGVRSKHAYLTRQREIDEAIASGEAEAFSVVVCDVNGLKHINDTLGHKAGDEYICAASKMICEIYHNSPVYRLGGDEFALVLSGHDYDIRDELLQMLHNRSVDNISLGRVVVSGGMSEFDPAADSDFHAVFERADGLMYQEKMLLKSLGAVTRDGGPADKDDGSAASVDNELLRERINKSIELSEDEDNAHVENLREELTNLYKKEYFWQGVAKYDELYPDTPMDAVMVDITHFHMINERYGRDFGDDVLRHVGVSIQNYAKKAGGIACRRSVDEFEIYCPHRDSYSDIAAEVKGDSEAGSVAAVRLRIGVYANVDKTLRVGQRFDRAKMAADNVRTGHIDNIGYYNDGMYEDALYKEELLEDFHTALEEKQFEVYFQPKYDIRGEKPVLSGAEALARWNHPELGLLQPADFVPVLEENGRIYELDKYIWRETAAIVSDWKERFGFGLPVSVNVSRIDMMSEGLRGEFAEILTLHGLTRDDITLEITESAYTNDEMNIIRVARELHSGDPGFRIEMDDFGSGYSSLGMLYQLPVDSIKLDMSFVRNYFGDDKGESIMRLIIGMAGELGAKVIAEGVETKEQLESLREMGCGYAQGFYFSEPVTAAEFEKLI